MNIVILGAGQVGASLARNLANDNNDITIIDTRSNVLRELREKLDIRTQQGHASHPDVLSQANADQADMLIAVTNSDEINMVACQIAYKLFRTPTRIARIRGSSYLQHEGLFCPEHIPIDVLISPEQLITDYIYRLITTPGTLQVLDFAGGAVQLVAIKATHEASMIGYKISDVADSLPDVDFRLLAIYRQDKAIIPTAETQIEANDEVFVLARSEHVRVIVGELRGVDKPIKRVMIAGGGNIGGRLAAALENSRIQVKIIEHNAEVATELAESLDGTIVLEGDSADESLLFDENIDKTDIFCAVTNDDEANILSAMLAKRMGARKVLSLINRPGYAELVEGAKIDLAVSPQQITIGALLTHIRSGDIVSVHALRKGSAEVMEVVAHGSEKHSRVVGRTINEIKLPPGSTVGAIVRDEEVIMASQQLPIKENDHLIILLTDKRYTPAVEKLFQVGIGYI